MSVSVTTPLIEEEVSAADAPFVESWIPAGNYLFAGCNTSPGKLVRISKTSLASRTVLTFPADGNHVAIFDLLYDEVRNRIYVLFANTETDFITISEVNPDDLSWSDVLETSGNIIGPGSLTSDGTRLFFVSFHDEPSQVFSFNLTTQALDTELLISIEGSEEIALKQAHCVRYSDGKLYVTGLKSDWGRSWLAVVNPSTLFIEAISYFPEIEGEFGVDDLGFSASHVWMGFRDLSGRVRRFQKGTLTYSDIQTPVLSRCASIRPGASGFVWALYDNGRAVQFDTSDLTQKHYRLNEGQGYMRELLAEANKIYAVRPGSPSVITRYRLASLPGQNLWARVVGTAGFDVGNSAGVDTSGNCIFGGSVNGFIICNKYSPSGELLWTKQLGSGTIYAIATDSSDNIYIAGNFLGAGDFGGGHIQGSGYSDAFVAKYTSSGAYLWAKPLISAGDAAVQGMTIDAEGNLLITGFFQGTINIDGTILTAAGGNDIFIAKLSGVSGSIIWARSYGDPAPGNNDIGYAIAADIDGNCFITGQFYGSIQFGSTTIVSPQGLDMFLAKFSPNGVPIWAKRFGGSLADEGRGVAVFSNGDVVVCGAFMSTADFGSGPKMSTGNRDIFIAKFTANGTPVWDRQVGGSFTVQDYAFAVTVDGSDNVVVTGWIVGDASFGGPIIPSSGTCVFIAKYSSSGAYVWADSFGTQSNNRGNSVVTDAAGNIVIVGSHYTGMDFGSGTLPPTPGGDAFIAKFSP